MIGKLRDLFGISMGAIAAALAMTAPTPGIAAGVGRARGDVTPQRIGQRSFKKTSGHQSKSRRRQKGMIWVGGKWLFFRP